VLAPPPTPYVCMLRARVARHTHVTGEHFPVLRPQLWSPHTASGAAPGLGNPRTWGRTGLPAHPSCSRRSTDGPTRASCPPACPCAVPWLPGFGSPRGAGAGAQPGSGAAAASLLRSFLPACGSHGARAWQSSRVFWQLKPSLVGRSRAGGAV